MSGGDGETVRRVSLMPLIAEYELWAKAGRHLIAESDEARRALDQMRQERDKAREDYAHVRELLLWAVATQNTRSLFITGSVQRAYPRGSSFASEYRHTDGHLELRIGAPLNAPDGAPGEVLHGPGGGEARMAPPPDAPVEPLQFCLSLRFRKVKHTITGFDRNSSGSWLVTSSTTDEPEPWTYCITVGADGTYPHNHDYDVVRADGSPL